MIIDHHLSWSLFEMDNAYGFSTTNKANATIEVSIDQGTQFQEFVSENWTTCHIILIKNLFIIAFQASKAIQSTACLMYSLTNDQDVQSY